MGKEVERKFLLRSDAWRDGVHRSIRLVQGYLARSEGSAVRVRIDGDTAELNIKHTLDGIDRLEFEYPIPLDDAREMLEQVAMRPLIEKTRHLVEYAGHLWEIDEFFGDNAGLVVAEIELEDADEAFERPPWLGEEVSHDVRYYNSNLSKRPYRQW
ncbi:MAG: CYTH domain-containing protein [Chromatiaceae bacterium]|nr:CYTH domain-containing protein [Gammaproteobacteria bacterium]MCP5306493.1 CYTH domain-containing protein [Chromatiaceae bacterium]MCP5312045.1 CYTH domain-containing protein [Chromatiaceae bacterium]